MQLMQQSRCSWRSVQFPSKVTAVTVACFQNTQKQRTHNNFCFVSALNICRCYCLCWMNRGCSGLFKAWMILYTESLFCLTALSRHNHFQVTGSWLVCTHPRSNWSLLFVKHCTLSTLCLPDISVQEPGEIEKGVHLVCDGAPTVNTFMTLNQK